MSENGFKPTEGRKEQLSPLDQADRSVPPEDTLKTQEDPETLCPSCGRFVGAYEKCPYCGAELKKRMSLVIWKRIAVVGTAVGLFLMWLAAVKMEPPLIDVAQAGPSYNNAIVRVQGTVVNRRLEEARKMVRLDVADRSGRLTAMGFGQLDRFRELGNLPRVGDRVEIVGQLQISDQYGTSLFLNLPHKVRIMDPPTPEKAAISAITEEWLHDKVTVRGNVKYAPRYGAATITDGTRDLRVSLDPGNLGDDLPAIRPGDGLEITGILAMDRGHLTLIPGSLEDIAPAEVAPLEIAVRPIGEVTLDLFNEIVEVEGEVTHFRAFRTGGGSVTLADNTGRIGVPIFASDYDSIAGAGRLRTAGTRVSVRGTVGEYQGAPQIRPLSAEHVRILE